jgi:putative spermidine/putrescine transport system substrate-binding protein
MLHSLEDPSSLARTEDGICGGRGEVAAGGSGLPGESRFRESRRISLAIPSPVQHYGASIRKAPAIGGTLVMRHAGALTLVSILAFMACTPAAAPEGPTPGATPGATPATTPDATPAGTPALSGELVLASWGGVFTETTVANFADPFSAETGVNVVVADAPGEHVAQVQAQLDANRVTWDVIDSLDAASAEFMWDQGLLEPMPEDLKARLQEVSVEGAVTDFGILQSSISTIMICNPDEAQRCPTTPAEFFDTENFPGPRSLHDNALDTLMFALAADGVPYDQMFPLDVDRAFAKLDTIKDDVRVWWVSGDQSQQVIRDAEVVMGTIWNGRAKLLVDEGMTQLEFSWDGARYGPAYTVVVRDAPNRDAAFAYIEWYGTHPEAQAAWAEVLGYGVSHEDAVASLPDDLRPWLPTNPENLAQSIPEDASWWVENRETVERRWREWLGS